MLPQTVFVRSLGKLPSHKQSSARTNLPPSACGRSSSSLGRPQPWDIPQRDPVTERAQACNRPLTQPHSLLLGHGSKDADDSLLEDARTVEVLLRQRPIVHTVAC